MRQLAQQQLEAGQFLVFVIGAAHATKRLPTAKIMAICQQLKGQLIVLIGDRSDQERASQIIKVGQHIINACGQYNLHQSASIINIWNILLIINCKFEMKYLIFSYKRTYSNCYS